MRTVSVIVALDSTVDADAVEAALTGESVQVLGFVHGLEDDANPLQDTPSDVLVVACAEPSEDAVAFIRGACDRRPARPVVVLTGLRRMATSQASSRPEPTTSFGWRTTIGGASENLSEQLSFVLEKAVARRTGTPRSKTDGRPADLRARAEGGYRKDADRL